MEFWGRVAWGLGKGVLALGLLLGLFIAYAAYSERMASGQAEAFCGAIAAGADMEGLLEQALGQGADARQTRWVALAEGDVQLSATFAGASPMSRHICQVTARHGRVVGTALVYLD